MDETDGAADSVTTGVTKPPWIMDRTDGAADPFRKMWAAPTTMLALTDDSGVALTTMKHARDGQGHRFHVPHT